MKNTYITLSILIFSVIGTVHGQGSYENGPKSNYPFEIDNLIINVSNSANLFGYYNGPISMFLTVDEGFDIPLIKHSYSMMGGYDLKGDLRLTATTESMRPGPFLTDVGYYDVKKDWDRFWEMNSATVSGHIADFNDDNVIDNKQALIYAWPGRGNPHFGAYNGFELLDRNEELAPFFDRNGDGVYNPDDGDYPIIKGDRAVWWMVHSGFETSLFSRGDYIYSEIKGMAYAYDTNTENTLFLQYKITNKGERLNDFRYGHVVNSMIRSFSGIDTTRNLWYTYDVVSQIEYPNLNYSIEDTPLLGILDLSEDDRKSCNSSGVYLNGGRGDFPQEITDPEIDFQYYNYISSRWKDNTKFTYGGIGYNLNSTDYVNHLFPDNPADPLGWSMCTAKIEGEEMINLEDIYIQSIMSNGPYDFAKNETLEFNYAIIQADDISYPCPDISGLQDVADEVILHYENNITSTEEIEEYTFSFYPNPVGNAIHLVLEDISQVSSIQLRSIDGRLLVEIPADRPKMDIDVSHMKNGVYVLSLVMKNGPTRSSKVIVLK